MEEVIINVVFLKVEILVLKGVGNVILSKKNRNDEELDGWFVGLGGKFKGKKVGFVKNKEKERIFLFLDVFILFGKMKFLLFIIVGDVVKCFEEVKVKKEYFV